MKFILAILMSAVVASPALAGQWTGVSLGVHFGENVGLNDISVDPVPPGPFNIELNGLGGAGVMFGVDAHADLQVSNNAVVGAFVTYDKLNDEFKANASFGGFTGTLTAPELSRWTVGGRAGFLANPGTLLYGLFGYTQQQNGDIVLAGGGSSIVLTVPTLHGITVGGGIETMISPSVSLRGEYDFTHFNGVDLGLPGGGGGLKVSDMVDTHAVHVDLSWHIPVRSTEPVQPVPMK